MIRAQLTLTDGKTPGQWRKGAAVILACIARGCRIVPNDRNAIPDEWSTYIVSGSVDNIQDQKDVEDRQEVPESDGIHANDNRHEIFRVAASNTGKPKRGRPKKVKT